MIKLINKIKYNRSGFEYLEQCFQSVTHIIEENGEVKYMYYEKDLFVIKGNKIYVNTDVCTVLKNKYGFIDIQKRGDIVIFFFSEKFYYSIAP